MTQPITIKRIINSPLTTTTLATAGRDVRERPYKPVCYPLGFKTAGLEPCIAEAHKVVQWWLNDIMEGQFERRRWVTLFGKSGTGKTHLAKAAMAIIRNSGRRVMFRRWGDALDSMLGGKWELMGEMMRVPVLMLDDIGMEYTGGDKARGINAAKLGELLDERLGKWTLLTSNLSPRQLSEVLGDARIASRMYRGGSELVDMRNGADYEKVRYKSCATHAEREAKREKPAMPALTKPKENNAPVATKEEMETFWRELREEMGMEARP